MPFFVAAATGHLGSVHMTPPPGTGGRDDFMDGWEPEGTLHAVSHGDDATLCGQPVDGSVLRLFPGRVFHRDTARGQACPTCEHMADSHGGAG